MKLSRPLLTVLIFFLVLCPVFGRSDSKYSDVSSPDFFPVFAWDGCRGWDDQSREFLSNGLESMANCHFNLAGFVPPQDLKNCRKAGLGAIVVPEGRNINAMEYFKEWRNLSDAEIDSRIRSTVKAAGNNPAIMGYFITDEPNVSDFPALGKAVAAVKKYAPGKLAYINLFPDYATIGSPDMSQLGTSNYTEYLERFVAEVKPQVISYDNYTVTFSNDFKNREKARSYFRNLLEVRRVAQKYNLPCLNIVCANQIRPNYPIPSPANLALQAYTTLAAGYRGVTWYTYYGRGFYASAPIGFDGRKTPTWFYLAEINRQITTLTPVMSKLKSTGVYFSAPAMFENLPMLPGGLVQSVNSTVPLMIGEFRNANEDVYVMAVNLSLESSGKFDLKLQPPYRSTHVISTVDGKLEPFVLNPKEQARWLAAGHGILMKLDR